MAKPDAYLDHPDSTILTARGRGPGAPYRTPTCVLAALVIGGCGGSAAPEPAAMPSVDLDPPPALPERAAGGPVEFEVKQKAPPPAHTEKAHGNAIMRSLAETQKTGPLQVPQQCAGHPAPAHQNLAPSETMPGATAQLVATDGPRNDTKAPTHPESAPQSGPAGPDQSESGCVPPRNFVKRLCARGNPSVALAMFAKNSPWERLYITGLTEAWNVAGDATSAGKLEQHEEVLVLQKEVVREGEIQVGGEKSLYALRWNGSCVMLSESQVTDAKPYRLRHAAIEWNWLESPLQESLRQDPAINEAYRARRNECRGGGFGKGSAACQKLEKRLISAVVEYVRGGGTLTEPQPIE